MRINELQRRALLALIRERYGCKYSCLPADRWKEVAIW